MRSYLDRWVRQLIKRGIRSGLIEGSNVWLSVGALAWLFRFLTKHPAEQVSTEQLRLGESVIVTHLPAPPRSRRAKKKAARKSAKQQQAAARAQAKKEASRRYARAAAKAAMALKLEEEVLARRDRPNGKTRRGRRRNQDAGVRVEKGDAEDPA